MIVDCRSLSVNMDQTTQLSEVCIWILLL